VHWHFMSVKAQPEPEAATAKQGICSDRVSIFILFEPCSSKRSEGQIVQHSMLTL
jgi:hypothetical protein